MHEHDQRLRWLSGFSGAGASVAVVTVRTASHVRDEAVLWTDARFLQLADEQLDCSWELRQLRSPMQLADWLLGQMLAGDKVGADPRVFLDTHWDALASRLCECRAKPWPNRLLDPARAMLDTEANAALPPVRRHREAGGAGRGRRAGGRGLAQSAGAAADERRGPQDGPAR